MDGVYVRGEDGELKFHPLGEPTYEEVAQVAAWTRISPDREHQDRSIVNTKIA